MPRRQSLLFKLVDGLQFSFAFVGRMLKQDEGVIDSATIFRKENYGIVFPSNSPYRKPVNEALLSSTKTTPTTNCAKSGSAKSLPDWIAKIHKPTSWAHSTPHAFG